MCGITGIFHKNNHKQVNRSVLEMMASTLDHRGPDERGFYADKNIGLGQTRLSIIDLAGGTQPIFNEDRSICVVFNGEIFNYIELGEQLKKKGHNFYTKSDTEVIVHAYEEYGYEFLEQLNGQFAIALFDTKKGELLLARDRVGIRPLFYSNQPDGTFLFGSEMKAILSYPGIATEIDPDGLNQVFTFWANVPPRTVFKNIKELPPGTFMTISKDKIAVTPYWNLEFPAMQDYEYKPLKYYKERLAELLYDAVTIRLRADVPVASYLSGGLDSSIISSLVKRHHNNNLITFSVAFSDPKYDERSYQMKMVDHLKTDHRIIQAEYEKIGNVFSDVIWYAEKPMIRTAPAPLYILSRLVRDNNIKVVLTGEGADEVFGGYNIIKEDKVRRFWAKYPESKIRPLLLSRIYPYINDAAKSGQNFWQLFFKKNLTDTSNRYYSHQIRWSNTSQVKKFFREEYKSQFDDSKMFNELEAYTHPDLGRWHPFARVQYLEMRLFMAGYLLSSQGDRMMMGNSVEGRFPFLDHRLIEFANTIPPEYKMNVLNEKYVLKKAYQDMIPDGILKRDKQPYRAPIAQCFSNGSDNLASRLFSDEKISEIGYFDRKTVGLLKKKIEKSNGQDLSARDDMAIVGIVSTQLLHHHFLS
jgi:asparagine synthase (glutamine-hydrolysing)